MSPALTGFLQRWVITSLAVLVAANVVPGIRYDSGVGLIVASLVLGVFNAVLKPIVMILTLPLMIVTLGFFTILINASLLYLVGQIVRPFHVDTFVAALLGSLVISVVSLGANVLTGTGQSRMRFQWKRGRQPPSRRPPPGPGGPVIDV